jgi:putative chitinase
MELTVDILKQMAKRPADAQKARTWDAYISALTSADATALLDRLEISKTAARLAMLLANMLHETGGLIIVRENMNYAAPRLMQVWPRWFPSLDFAKRYEHRPQEIANYVYGKATAIGQNLGNTKDPDDGWNYRGGGLMQTTGRAGYREFGKFTAIDLEKHPELIEFPINSLNAGCAEWNALKLNSYADAENFKACCNGINRGNPNSSGLPIGWSERRAWLSRSSRALGIGPDSFGIPTEEEILDFDYLNSDDYPHGRDTEVPFGEGESS